MSQINIRAKKIIFILISCFILASCGHKNEGPNVKKITLTLDLRRFDKELFNTDQTKLSDSLPSFRKHYGSFFELFNTGIINIGSSYSSGYVTYLIRFITDPTVTDVYNETQKIFANTDSLKKRLEWGFKHYKYYFPNANIPIVATYISGLNQNMFASDSVLGIGLDKYLGAKCSFYERMGVPEYICQRFIPQKIASDAFFTWGMNRFALPDSAEDLLSQMLYQGKIYYFVKQMLPDEADSLVFGYTDKQIKWCPENEKQMWTFLVEHKLIFSTDAFTNSRFLDEAPYTKDFPKESPGRAVSWLGYRIIARYMAKNTSVTLSSLMENNNYMAILAASKYNP